MARKSRELARRPAVAPDDEPSVEWGWHGGFPRGMMIAGWATVAILLLMMIDNDPSQTARLWLIGTAALMAFGLVRYTVRKRRPWPR